MRTPIHRCTAKVYALNGITLFQTTYPSLEETPLHDYREHGSFSFVLKRGYCEIARHGTYRMVRGRLICQPHATAYSNASNQELTCLFTIRAEAERLDQVREHPDTWPMRAILDEALPIRLITAVLEEFKRNDSLSTLVIEDRLIKLLRAESASAVDGADAPSWLRRAEEIIHSHFSETIRLAGIAEEVDVHPVHLCRSFRQYFHCSIGEYIRMLRLELACRQLSASSIPLVTVAMHCGFADQSHFSRTFKRFTGMTPLQYRGVFQDLINASIRNQPMT